MKRLLVLCCACALTGCGSFGGLGEGDTGGGPPISSGSTGAGVPSDPPPEDPGQQVVREPASSLAGCLEFPGATVRYALPSGASTAAAQYARSVLLSGPGGDVDPNLLRASDFVAYYGPAAPADGVTLRWFDDPLEDNPLLGVIQVDYTTRAAARAPLRLVVLVDTSPSAAHALGLEADALRALVRGFATDHVPGDELTVLSFSRGARTELEGPMTAELPYGGFALDTFSLQQGENGNDLEAGIVAALEAAAAAPFDAHVLVVTDGGATLSDELVGEVRSRSASEGTRVSAAQIAQPVAPGVPVPYAFGLLDGLAVAGAGASFYIADAAQASRVFEQRFGRAFGVHATGVQIEVAVPALFSVVGPPEVLTFESGGDVGGAPSRYAGSGATYSLRVRFRAACPDVFAQTVPLGDFAVTVLAGGAPHEGPVSFTASETFGETPETHFQASVLATALAMRSRQPADVDKADALLKAGAPCDGCDYAELQALLDAVEARLAP